LIRKELKLQVRVSLFVLMHMLVALSIAAVVPEL
jgi:hypothetical protein